MSINYENLRDTFSTVLLQFPHIYGMVVLVMFQPRFVITQNILKHISQVEVSKEIIENSPLVPQWEVKFREEALLRS
ncbi:MAG: hypothetical protein M3P33_01220, partial [bacterium]|nr:hypothetical protein [bacterium]